MTRSVPSRFAPVLVALAGLVSACSGSDAASDTTTHHHDTGSAPFGAPDRVISGPQGNLAQFVVECTFSHAAPDDPIVHPDAPGASHIHVFFGATTTDAFSTVDTLRASDTTCNQPADTASYWAPAVLRGQVVQTPVKSVAYYRAGIDVDPTTVQPYPFGLKIVAGNAGALEPQPTSVVAWACGAGSIRDVTPPECPAERNLRLLVTFPDCWNGSDLDSADHRSHMAYSTGGQCPTDHPVPVPQLQFSVEYPVTGNVDDLILASGSLLTGHADFYNAWDPDRLQREVNSCLHRDVVCGVASGRTDG
jgi:hypothetical protein